MTYDIRPNMNIENAHKMMKAGLRHSLLLVLVMMTSSHAMAQVRVQGSVFGGGNEADVKTTTSVNISTGQVDGNVYGGGNLGDVGTIEKNTTDYNYRWTNDPTVTNTYPFYNYNNTGKCTVEITGDAVVGLENLASTDEPKDHGNVFGGGKGNDVSFYCEKGMVYTTEVKIEDGTVYGNVYGGGQIARVESHTKVIVGEDNGSGDPEIKGSVFGAGAGINTHGYSALVRGNPVVTIQGNAKVEGTLDNQNKLVDGTGNVYGGGEIASVGKHKVKTPANEHAEGTPSDLPMGMPWTLDNTDLGKCTVNVIGSAEIAGNVFGAGKGVVPAYDGSNRRMTLNAQGSTWETLSENDYNTFVYTLALTTDTYVTIGGTRNETTGAITPSGNPTINGSVYGGSENGFVQYHTDVKIVGGQVDTNVYGGGKGLATFADGGRVSGNAKTTVSGGSVGNDVYGGGAYGIVKESVAVNILGGEITKDVYGGGALANTNTANWQSDTQTLVSTYPYHIVSNLTAGTSVVTGLYYIDNGNYREITTAGTKAVAGTDYYRLTNTTVNLLGGTIGGNAYGGGLGNATTPAYVYGDVKVNLNGMDVKDYDASIHSSYLRAIAASGGTDHYELKTTTNGSETTYAKGASVNQIFGANNVNGSPKANVTVHVYATQNTGKGTIKAKNARHTELEAENATTTTYDVVAVYGGGNQAAYVPQYNATNGATSYKTHVIIEGCEFTSIKTVYGGGNAASVPETNVDIVSAYEIETVFGGGNGKSTATFTNPGADVGVYKNASNQEVRYGTGYANATLKGGIIHEAYGGSNEKGNIKGKINLITDPDGDCDLDIGKMVGAGKNAEIDGDVVMILDCMPESKVPLLFAGADNANVNGNVELTITNGSFGKVFGGNNEGGAIKGSITVNIEETGCRPIEIDELYGCGNQAAYSVYGYKEVVENGKTVLKPRNSMSDGTAVVPEGATPYSDDQWYKDPEVNIFSCTRIGEVYGGGWGSDAVVYGNPIVNINQVYGIKSDGNGGYNAKATELGEIVDVFGGGNAAKVEGNTTVNIGTKTTVGFVTNPTLLGTYTQNETSGKYEGIQVDGANITGSVYGGGNLADVTGSTQVNICAIKGTGDTYTSVTEGTEGVTIAGDVFGAGKGTATDVSKALVSTNTTIVIGGGEIKKSVYGGGQLSQVGGNTDIRVIGGTIGTTGLGKDIYGNIYGGGKGNKDSDDGNEGTISDKTLVTAGLIKGNTNITVSSGDILHNIYGGGAHGSVGTFVYDDDGVITGYTSGGKAAITITGGTIGTTGKENGMIFGSSRGDVGAPESIDDKLAWVYETEVKIGTLNATTGPNIKGSVYGSGENGHTYQNASVAIHSGKIGIHDTDNDVEYKDNPKDVNEVTYSGKDYNYPYRGNVYGGGCGTDKYDNNTKYNPLAGIVQGTATVVVDGGQVVRNVYGAGAMGSVDVSTSVTISGNAVIGVDGDIDENGNSNGFVYAAARGELTDTDKATVGNSSLIISGGTVWGSAFGGGQNGYVTGAVTVNLTGGEVKKDVYGGGALAQTNTQYDANDNDKKEYKTTVNLGNSTSGTSIGGDLYGGGLGRVESGSDAAIAANVNGPVTVMVTKGKANNVFGCNNLNGAPQKTVTVNINGTNDPTVTIPLPIRNVYGGGNQANYDYAVEGQPLQVNIEGGTIGNVFGGGLSADVAGGIEVNVRGGTVKEDVYGGGALANTNTANWDPTGDTWADQTKGTYYAEVKHLTAGTSNVSNYWTRTGGAGTEQNPYTYTQASGTAASGITYYKKLDNFLKVAAERTLYETHVNLFGGTVGNAYGGGLGQFATTYTAAEATAFNTEHGLRPEDVGYISVGDVKTPAVAAMVYGDVTVRVNGTAFTSDVEYINNGSENVAKHGRVFGCNNLNGTPKGKVEVIVSSTKHINHPTNHVKGEFEIQGVYGGGNLADYEPGTFDNSENLHVEFGQKASVTIIGCKETSINKVYGGGNAAKVPCTDVTINGAFEIGYVFGGGNGGDKVNYGNGWEDNPGADVLPGYANVLLRGGTIGQAFGGSDTKGTVGGADIKQETTAECPLRIVNLYGAGNGEDANSEGDINIAVSACGDGSEIQNVFGGSYKANIKGDVTLTIKSGIFTSVYGGNDRMGSIGGNITVNIEETDECSKPIIIQNLYGGCYQTPYPGEGAKRIRRDAQGNYVKDANNNYILDDFENGKITVNVKSATRIDRIFGGSENGAVTGDTEVNINMVEGSQSGHNGVALPSYYGETGASIPSNITVTGANGYVEVHGLVTVANTDPTKTPSSVVGYYTRSGESEPYTYTAATGFAQENTTYYKKSVIGNIAEGIGTIGEVFGGGNRGNVSGNATVNIVTESTVTMESLTTNKTKTVRGADITGDVFGGGNLADVLGKTYVNICAKKNGSAYEPVAQGDQLVKIGGNVYGGGKGDADNFFCDKGMVGQVNTNQGRPANATELAEYDDKGTHIHIGNGQVGTLEGPVGSQTLKAGTGNVYGGGEVGRVEYHSVVEIGLIPPTTGGTSSAPVILGNVFGGGKGVETHGYAALLRGNTTVTVQQDAQVRNSVYGGGEISTIGRFWIKNVNNISNGVLVQGATEPPTDLPDGMPYALRDGGKCTVSILGDAVIGPTTAMTMPKFEGNVFGAGKGFLPKVYDYSEDNDAHRPKRTAVNGDDYFVDEDAYMVFIETQALVDETYVNIGGNAFVKGSVYGGSENGRVLNDTHVNIAGGQVGWGNNDLAQPYSDDIWAANYNPTADLECAHWDYVATDGAPYDPFAVVGTDGTYVYDYSSTYSVIKPGDRRSTSDNGKPIATDGHTFYGNVFGGGSGKDPYAPGRWHRKAGAVGGDTFVNITGGHILTSVYGGNEHTDVGTYAADGLTPRSGGKCIVNMTGGTLGVPRTLQQISEHPVTCYLFGAGKGDQRIFFNTWTNVISTEVNISGTARIYGSTFGGGEDGHVMNDAVTNIGDVTTKTDKNANGTYVEAAATATNVRIGTWGTSYVDGNVFGGGRGFSGEALTAGTVGGNVEININGGTMLGSVYGGGRLASVGTYFENPTLPNGDPDPLYGQFKEDVLYKSGDNIPEGKAVGDIKVPYGHVTIDISGGTIGNASPAADSDYSKAKYSGNVFGGSMGRLTLLDNTTINDMWPELAQVKTSAIRISEASGKTTSITRNVYGGGEYGTVRENASISISSGTIGGNVFGGGYGSDDYKHPTPINVYWDNAAATYVYTPMQWAGTVGGNTSVSISGGKVKKNVYGGGELASVGLINYLAEEVETTTDSNSDVIVSYKNKHYKYLDIIKHADIDAPGTTSEKVYGFGLSWPYEFTYVPCTPTETTPRGKATVTISGGRIGTGYDDGTGYVFGGGKGKAFERYTEGFCANVRETEVNINYGTTAAADAVSTADCIASAVYGGGEDGHVYGNTEVNITGGLIGLSVYGGGKGEGTYPGELYHIVVDNQGNKTAGDKYNADLPSWTAGKVYGNTNVNMSNGHVLVNVYGGGNLASVGKGNYASGYDDYYKAGYGETLYKNESNYENLWTSSDEFDPAEPISDENQPTTMADYFLSSGKCSVTITGGTVGTENGMYGTVGGQTAGSMTGMVFGGSRGRAAEDVGRLSPRYVFAPDFFLGYVNNANVIIGTRAEGTEGETGYVPSSGPTIYSQVFGGGRDGHVRNSTHVVINGGTIGQAYNTYDSITDEDDKEYQSRNRGNVYGSGSGMGVWSTDHHGTSSGSVTRNTTVDVYGGTIYNNVYGGGAMSSVGPPTIPPTAAPAGKDWSQCTVNIYGGNIGVTDDYEAHKYGGCVFGASRGGDIVGTESPDDYATTLWNEVNIMGGVIAGNVYGGGQAGRVKKSNTVNLMGGSIAHDAYGGGKGTDAIAAHVGGDVTVKLNEGLDGEDKGCSVNRIFGCNDLNGTPKGHVLVHVYATRHPKKKAINDSSNSDDDYKKFAKYGNVTGYTQTSYAELETLAAAVGMTATEISNYKAAITAASDDDAINTAIDNWREAISLMKYDVEAVYGGGNLAKYVPDDALLTYNETNKTLVDGARTEVIIDGCDLTSIKQVYGGGNAASTPATFVRINEAYEIDEVFGGGNGKDPYVGTDGKWYQNPGANIGYYDFTEIGSGSGNSKTDPILQVDKANAKTKEDRQNPANGYTYGSGVAQTHIVGGRIHMAYGGSNTRGNINILAMSVYQESGTCPLNVDKTYGAGKNAETDAQVIVNMDCVIDMAQIFGGSTNADVNNDIMLEITNGSYEQVFGGNDTNGAVNGSITVKIEEKGCTPIRIKELYAGGYLAPYSIYGYEKYTDGTYKKDDNGHLIPLKEGTAKLDPHIDVISATQIGDIYGGGYKADVVGNPHINVNMMPGYIAVTKKEKPNDGHDYVNEYLDQNDGKTYIYVDDVPAPENGYKTAYVLTDLEALTDEESDGKHTHKSMQNLGYIGNIFGGGNQADIIGSTYVEIGTGKWTPRTTDEHGVVSEGAVQDIARKAAKVKISDYYGNFMPDGETLGGGFVFGGGNNGDVTGNTNITMGDGATVENRIYGGGNLGDIGTIIKNTTDYNYKWVDANNEYNNTGVTNVTINGGTVGLASPTEAAPGNVFGGGKGDESSFYCEKGMVYSTNINITNGTVHGNVYGGGEIGRVENNTSITIGTGDGVDPTGSTAPTSTPTIEGDVFGGGKGLKTHGYSALVRGNPTVTVQGNAKLMKSVYGGGEIASVGSFWVNSPNLPNDAPPVPEGTPIGMPYKLKVEDSGTCTVTIGGYAEIGPDNMVMTKAGGPDDTGYIFGAGKGILPGDYTYSNDDNKPKRMVNVAGENSWQYFANETAYLTFIETLAMTAATDVTIGNHAFVKGSVYGGSENGHVLNDTKVTIADYCQIGNGYVQMDEDGNYLAEPYSVNRRYTATEWAEGRLYKEGETNYQHSLPECASWPYGKTVGTKKLYLPYDIYDLLDNTQPASNTNYPKFASDGHTFYGNVFGGGSGYYPYRHRSANKVPGETAWTEDPTKSAAVGQSVDADGYSDGVWLRSAGAVFGNSEVIITGGHILTSVYGGNEMTDVGKSKLDPVTSAPTIPDKGGTSKVTMSGGTLGVPRTLGQIAAHPVTCYLFGAGKGDQRINFNTWTNVNEAIVEVTDNAHIYGSVFGGGEDGHVLGNVSVDIKTGKDVNVGTELAPVNLRYPYIGTTGTSYVDGNVFGGGRGFSGEALTAGSVGGNVEVNISDGTILGSVYGGGRLASVGTRFTAVTDPYYGQLQPDVADDPATTDVDETSTHGHITVNISGGTIGNDLEDITVAHTKGGNVFGGSMGRLTLLNGSINPDWPKAAVVKTSKVNISGDALIKGNVYGGGELGMVRGDVHVTIGGVLGDDNETITSNAESDNPTIKRDVYGGGYGSDDYTTQTTITAGGFSYASYTFTPMQLSGIVCGDTYVNMKRGSVEKNIYGGGEMATVGLIDFKNAVKHDDIANPGASNEKIYGFGLSWPYKMDFIPYDDSGVSDAIGGTTHVNIMGGRMGITGKDFMGPFNAAGQPLDITNNNAVLDPDNNAADKKKYKAARKDNGDVFGAGKGIAGSRYDYAFCANVKNTVVTINIPGDDVGPTNYKDLNLKYDCITGSVYAGGENGHVIENTELTLMNGLVGHAVYGGGKGKDTYHKTRLSRLVGEGTYEDDIYSVTAGKVYGNTKVKIEGGYVVRNVYGGGNMASVGKGNYAGGADDYSTNGYGETLYKDENNKENLWTTSYHPENGNSSKDYAWYFLNSGKTEVEVTGGTIGYVDAKPKDSMKDGLPYGNVFGGCRGESAPNITESPRYLYCPLFYSGYVNETKVIIGDATKIKDNDYNGPKIFGSVYGGGQDGHVRRDTYVTINKGDIGLAYDQETTAKTNVNKLKTADLDDPQWLLRGNVFGAGSGIGKYQYDFDYDGQTYTDANDNGDYDEGETIDVSSYHGNSIKEVDYSTSAGSVTRFTQVDILGGTIHRNVYGGGSMASVGAPKIPLNRTDDPDRKGATGSRGVGYESLNIVNIASKVGTPDGYAPETYSGNDSFKYNKNYGGEVYGASRGIDENNESLATSVWTEVNLHAGARVLNNVFGGGDNGMVKQDAEVNVGVPTTITPTSLTFTKAAGTNHESHTITVTAKGPWSVTSDKDWLTVNPASGTGDGTISVTASNNVAGADDVIRERTATITITGNFGTKTIAVRQTAN